MDNSVNCPVCNKSVKADQIESHIDKCLFLNSSASSSTVLPSKRIKLDNKTKKGDIKVEPTIREISKSKKGANVPLAEKVRPVDITDFIGQEHLTGEGKIIRILLERNEISSMGSMILWGPPGCGKTTIATIISRKCKENAQHLRFVSVSALMCGVNDIKEIVAVSKNELQMKRKTVLFMDEIHRFNKLQQDIFLPHVESGLITLIGATTENPSFSLNSALLSRCRVVVLEKLSVENVCKILHRAIEYHQNDEQDDCKVSKPTIEKETVEWLAEMCDGDARIALNTLQVAFAAAANDSDANSISLEKIKSCLEKSHMMYDRKGEEHYNIISALHKSIRSSDDNASLYWTTRMIVSGEDPLYIARRMIRAASEDIGLADPNALHVAVTTYQGCQNIGMPECDVLLCQCAVYLARAPKSRAMEDAMNRCKKLIKSWKGAQPSVPLHLRNAPTKLMRDLGYGRRNSNTSPSCMPEGLDKIDFFS